MAKDMIYLLICILVLQLKSVSVKSNEFNIIGLFPINSTSAEESEDLTKATTKSKQHYLGKNASVDIQIYNNSDSVGVAMKIMLDIFAQPKNFTAIIGPGSKGAILGMDQFLKTIPMDVLHLVYNSAINPKEYLHNTAPSVSVFVDVLVDLMVKMKWNYIAIMIDSMEFSRLSYKLFEEKARRNRICIGIVEVINRNEKDILEKIFEASIDGILVFGKEDTVRAVSRNVNRGGNFRFIFASNENLHSKIIENELPDHCILIFCQLRNSDDSLNYISNSVDMALKWFEICQDKCRDLKQGEVSNGTLAIYQMVKDKQRKVGTNGMINFSEIKTEKSFCKKECKKCRLLDTIPNSYVLKKGTHYIVLLIPIHKNDIDPFKCSQSIRLSESVDLIEATRFAIKTSIDPHLGLIIVDNCFQPMVVTEQLIGINYTKVLGVIGGFFSETTIPAAEVLTRLQIPQVAYGGESHVLSDRVRFPYFQSTSISLDVTAKAILLLCKRMGWRAINIMYNNEAYGLSGQSLIVKYAALHGICIVNNIKVEDPGQKFYIYLNQLRKTKQAKVVVNFMLEKSQKEWWSVLKKDQADNEFVFIITYKLSPGTIETMIKNKLNNQMFIEHNRPTNKEFQDYYANLKESDINSNPWAKEFIEEHSRCRFEGSFNTEFNKECKYNLQIDSISNYHDLLIYATYALINGTLQFCNSPDVTAERISKAIRNTKFNISGDERRLFDDEGKGQFLLFSLERVQKESSTIEYEKLAIYNHGTWRGDNWDELSAVTSICDGKCTVCPEDKKTLYLVFVILDGALGLIILICVGVIIHKKRGVIRSWFK